MIGIDANAMWRATNANGVSSSARKIFDEDRRSGEWRETQTKLQPLSDAGITAWQVT